jgi:hypothetical protein
MLVFQRFLFLLQFIHSFLQLFFKYNVLLLHKLVMCEFKLYISISLNIITYQLLNIVHSFFSQTVPSECQLLYLLVSIDHLLDDIGPHIVDEIKIQIQLFYSYFCETVHRFYQIIIWYFTRSQIQYFYWFVLCEAFNHLFKIANIKVILGYQQDFNTSMLGNSLHQASTIMTQLHTFFHTQLPQIPVSA